MNLYALLPLTAIFANLLLGIYILYRSPKAKLNRLYALFAFALVIWALGTFLTFTSLTSGEALYRNKLAVTGSLLIPAFLLHFFLVFSKREFISREMFYMPLYLPALFFILVNFTTNLITEISKPSWWGYSFASGILYIPVAFYIIGYFIAGILICYRFYSETTSAKEKVQAKFLVIATTIPLVGGVMTEAVPSIIGFDMIPLSTAFITISAVIIAYTIIKYRLMTPVSFSIQRKLILGFLVIVLLIGATGYSYSVQSQETLKKSIGENAVLLAQETLDKIDRDIYNRIERWESYIATNPKLHETVAESNQEFEKLDDIQNYIDTKDQEWVSAPKEELTSFMQEIINNELSKRLRNKVDFYEKKEGYVVFGEVFVTNRYGANVAQTGKTSDYYQADEEWWQEAKDNDLYVRDVEYDESAGIYSTDIGIGIGDEDGNFIGAMKIILNIREAINVIEELEAEGAHEEHRTMHLNLVNKDGKLIYSTREFEFLEDMSDKLLSHFFEGEERHRGYFTGYGAGEEILFAHAHSEGYKDYKGLGWFLVVEHETEEIFVPVVELANIMIIVTAVVAIFGILLSILISRSFTRPIIRLRDAASEIGKGKLDTKIEVESKDEIGELASAFGQMTGDLKVYQAQIRRHAEELEGKVKERTKELDTKVQELTDTKTAVLNMMEDTDETNKELIKTQEELKKSLSELKEMDIKKNQFISIAAHELKTPLTSIHGFSQLLQNRKVANNFTKRNKYLKIMDHETKRLAKLVGDILDLSRIDLGTVKLNLDEVDVNELLKGLESEMNVQIKEKGLKSEYDMEKDIPRIVTDKEKLTEILINLIINAVKYTSEGIITVNIFRENKKMHFVVKDTGIGIAKEKHEKIFERFYQIDSSYTRKTPGVGLGLALCKEFVELLGGKIWIKSELGKGSEFHFTLPLKSVPKKYVREEEMKAEESLEKAEETRKRVKRLGIGK